MKNLLISLAVLVLFTACKSPQQATFVAVSSTTTTVNAAIGSFNDYRKLHNLPDNDPTVQKVRTLVVKYVATLELAKKASIAYNTSIGTANEQSLESQFNAALDTIGASASELILLINSITQ